MALRPADLYPGQTTVDAEFPHGKAKNQDSPGDGSGFPLEMQWVNEVLGAQQALLAHAGITPNGTQDRVGSSQYLQAVQAAADARIVAQRLPGAFTFAAQSVLSDVPLALSAEPIDPGSAYSSPAAGMIQVASPGFYMATAQIDVDGMGGFWSGTDWTPVYVDLEREEVLVHRSKDLVPRTFADNSRTLRVSAIVGNITVPAAQRLNVKLHFTTGSTISVTGGRIDLVRVR